MSRETPYYFECQCADSRHLLRFHLDPMEDHWPGELWAEILLNPWKPWYRRLWGAVQYVFGKPCGDFGSWMMLGDDVDRLMDMLQEHKDNVG